MPPQAKGENAKLSTRYWAVLYRNAPEGPRSPGHDGGGRRRVMPGATGARRARDGGATGVRWVLRVGANGATGGRNGDGLTR